MTASLPRISHEHHERLTRHLDTMPALGDLIGNAPAAELGPRIAETAGFLTDLLVPHIDAAEQALYPELERVLQNRHSMTPMRREHDDIRALVAEFVRLQEHFAGGRPTTSETVALRRIVFRLHAMLKVHLAEEQLYLGIIERGLSDERSERLATAMEHPGITAF